MPLVLGVDSSTQSTKVEIRDADTGRLLGGGRAGHPATVPPRSEQPVAAWWRALREASAAALAQAGADQVDAISVAGQQHGLVVLDRDGRPLRDAKLWNDTESAPQAAELVERLGPAEWARRCGSVPVASFTITKLAWLRTHEPEAFRRVARVLLPHDWVTAQLTSRWTTDRGDASGTGYWSPVTGRWDTGLLDLVADDHDWAAALPEVLDPAAPAGRLQASAAEQLGLRGTPVIAPGTGDNMAAALGLGLATGDCLFSVGTSGVVTAVTRTPVADPSGAVAGFADATGRFLPLVCTLNAGKVLDAAARLLGCGLTELDALAGGSPLGDGGPVLLPYLDGERTPNLPDASGVLAGLRSDVTREQLAAAFVEGVVHGLLDGHDALLSVTGELPGSVVLAGGGARSAELRHRLAALLGRPVLAVDAHESVAAGACVQAAACLAGTEPQAVGTAWSLRSGTEVQPEPVDRAALRASYAQLRELVHGRR